MLVPRTTNLQNFLLFRTTQDTIFFVLIVDTFPIFATLGTEIKVAMKVENEHLAEIPHFRVLGVRSKSGEVFGLDAVALDGEGIHQHGTEAPSGHPMRASSLGIP